MYALILKSDEDNSDYWICYHLTQELDELLELSCYSEENLYLPKDEYDATCIEELIQKPSCRTGEESSFAIYQFSTPINLSSKFQFSA